MNKYLALDCETGGTASQTSLLTTYLAVLDQELNLVDDLYLNCKPDNGVYIVTGKGMEVNGINLGEHDKISETYKECGTLLYNFLHRNTNFGKLKLIPLGHGVKFDCLRMSNDLISEGSWQKFVSYRVLDTATLGLFAIQLGLLPPDIEAGLSDLAKYFKVGEQNKTGHNAKHDVELSIGVYKKFLKLFLGELS